MNHNFRNIMKEMSINQQGRMKTPKRSQGPVIILDNEIKYDQWEDS